MHFQTRCPFEVQHEYHSHDTEASQLCDGCMQAFTADSSSKWLDFGAAGGEPSWLEIILPQPRRLTAYRLTSAGDAPERDPSDFTLEAVLGPARPPVQALTGGSTQQLDWSVLDAREGHQFAGRLQSQSFKVSRG